METAGAAEADPQSKATRQSQGKVCRLWSVPHPLHASVSLSVKWGQRRALRMDGSTQTGGAL